MKRWLLFLMFFTAYSTFAQTKREREYRIKKEEFPKTSFETLTPYLEGVKRLRFYKEEDGQKQSFEAKFKKGKLKYSVEFDENGLLEDVEFVIRRTDFPDETLYAIEHYLNTQFKKHRIKKMQQQYLNVNENTSLTLRNGFQNLLIPELRYELVITGKTEKSWKSYEMVFDYDGNHVSTRTIVPAKYDHVLY